MTKDTSVFCMLIEIIQEENKAIYEDLNSGVVIELNHDENFIEYLSMQDEDEQLCFWIDLERKEIINKDL